MAEPVYYQDLDACVEEVIRRIGKQLILGLPLGLGKPNPFVNALYRRVRQDASLHLKIMTALTLEKPTGHNDLERRFLEPLVERIFGNYPDLEYIVDVRRGRVPANVEVQEFYFKPGAFLNVPSQQQNYVSCNYTHAARVFLQRGANVLAQMVAKRVENGRDRFSLSCNPDVSLELFAGLREEERRGRTVVRVALVNNQLPYMYRDAEVEPAEFDLVIDHPAHEFTLFGAPNMAVSTADYMIGLHAGTLIRDGGTLQIGIGSLGDAIVYGCRLRQADNEKYRAVLADMEVMARFGSCIEAVGGLEPFREGLYGCSEMLVNGFWHLYEAGILKRRVYDSLPLQRLLAGRVGGETVTPELLAQLLESGAIESPLRWTDFEFLQQYGIFRADLTFADGFIEVSDTLRIPADLEQEWELIMQHCLGERLKNGIVMHGGFFLGPQSLYTALRELSDEESRLFCMTGVDYVNQLYGGEELKSLQRRHARFMNTTIMATLLGGAASDGLEDGRVVSGVGGQYNFVAMAHALPGARSILMLRSTRRKGAMVSSNIVWNYGHCTIPRHLRDIVVTEYGIADLRGKSDQEVIAALLNVADSRFQPSLLQKAKEVRKIAADYEIPERFRDNTPERLNAVFKAWRERGLFPDFPLGTDFTPEELVLGKVLRNLKVRMGNISGIVQSVWHAVETGPIPEAAIPYLARMRLDQPEMWRDEAIRRLIVGELQAEGYV